MQSSLFAPFLAPSFVSAKPAKAIASRRFSRALRRSIPTRRTKNAFNRFYDRLLTRRQKILFTTSFANLSPRF